MNSIYFAVFPLLFACFNVGGSASDCVGLKELSDTISYHIYFYPTEESCWSLPPSDSGYVTLNITRLVLPSDCDRFYVSVTEGANETYRFCEETQEPITSSENVTIRIVHDDMYKNASSVFYFNFEYKMVRSVLFVKGVNDTRKYLISKLSNQSHTTDGWGEEIPRAMTALSLAGETDYVREKRLITQLNLYGSSALLMNSTHPLSTNELTLFMNALTASCQNSRKFYDQDLLQILEEQATSSMIPNPGAILSACVIGGKLDSTLVDRMFYRLMQNSTHGFNKDYRAMSLMALTCLKKQSNSFQNNLYATAFYKATIDSLIQEQGPDGSFGNVYATALVTQALLATGQQNNSRWLLPASIRFLMQHVKNSSEVDLQMIFHVLPILNSKTLLDLGQIDCSNNSKDNKDEFGNGTKIQVFYSLCIGDQRKVIKTVSMVVPTNSSALTVMNKAQTIDPVFSFQSMRIADTEYIFKIGGIANDFEMGRIWTLYSMPSYPNGTLVRHDISADKLTMHHWEHLVMWFKTIRA